MARAVYVPGLPERAQMAGKDEKSRPGKSEKAHDEDRGRQIDRVVQKRQAAEAVLQATTNALIPRSISASPNARAWRRISAMGSDPYGPLAVSPT